MELHIRDVSKTYSNGVQALKDVTLTIPAGMYGLLGPNGAGKSTLMRILATLQEPDEGSIRPGDTDVLSQKDEVRKTLGLSRLDRRDREPDGPAATGSLRLGEARSSLRERQRSPHSHGPRFKVHVLPPEPEEFPLPHAGRDG